MGLDLTLLPLDYCATEKYPDAVEDWTARTQLQCRRRGDLFDAILAETELKGNIKEIPEQLYCYLAIDDEGENKYGAVSTNPYGSKLTWMTAKELLSFGGSSGVTDNALNRAVWAYLAALPQDWKIVLYWH